MTVERVDEGFKILRYCVPVLFVQLVRPRAVRVLGIMLPLEPDTTLHVHSVRRTLWVFLIHIFQPHLPTNQETNSGERKA